MYLLSVGTRPWRIQPVIGSRAPRYEERVQSFWELCGLVRETGGCKTFKRDKKKRFFMSTPSPHVTFARYAAPVRTPVSGLTAERQPLSWSDESRGAG